MKKILAFLSLTAPAALMIAAYAVFATLHVELYVDRQIEHQNGDITIYKSGVVTQRLAKNCIRYTDHDGKSVNACRFGRFAGASQTETPDYIRDLL